MGKEAVRASGKQSHPGSPCSEQLGEGQQGQAGLAVILGITLIEPEGWLEASGKQCVPSSSFPTV